MFTCACGLCSAGLILRWVEAGEYNVSLVQSCCLFVQAEDGIRDYKVTGVQTCALPICVLGTAWDIGLDPRAWWHLRRTITAFQPDVIHVHDSHALTLVATVAMGRKIVATRRVEFHIGRFGSWRRPDRIIAISAAVKNVLIADGIASGAVVVVHDGIDVDDVRRAGGVPLDIRREAGNPAAAPVAVNAAALTSEYDH